MYILLHLHIIQNRKGNVILTGRNCLAMSQGKHHLNKVRLDRQFLSNLRESCNANQPQLRSGKVQCITECTGSTSNNEFVTNLGITGCLNSYHIWCESPLLLQKSKVTCHGGPRRRLLHRYLPPTKLNWPVAAWLALYCDTQSQTVSGVYIYWLLTSSANGTVFCFYCLCRCYLMFLVR